MSKYLVDYVSDTPDKSYKDLTAAITKYSWVSLGDSSWVVSTSFTASQIRDDLKRCIDGGDSLFVAEIEGGWASYHLPPNVAQWLKNH